MKKIILISTLITIGLAFSINFAFADTPASTPRFTLNGLFIPPKTAEKTEYFDYDLTPGSTVTDAILIQNLDPTRYMKIGLGIKGTSISEREKTKYGLVTEIPQEWLEISENPVIIAPLEAKKVKFTLTIPEDVEVHRYRSIIKSNLGNFGDTAEEASKKPTSGAVGISLSIAKQFIINLEEGNPKHIDRTSGIIVEEKEKEESRIRTLRTNIYTFIQERFEIILIFIIILLLLKVAISKNNCINKKDNKKSNK